MTVNGNQIGQRKGAFSRVFHKLRSAIEKSLPMGYEDSKGFHYGHEPRTTGNDARNALSPDVRTQN
jgi:hypothetical protein